MYSNFKIVYFSHDGAALTFGNYPLDKMYRIIPSVSDNNYWCNTFYLWQLFVKINWIIPQNTWKPPCNAYVSKFELKVVKLLYA